MQAPAFLKRHTGRNHGFQFSFAFLSRPNSGCFSEERLKITAMTMAQAARNMKKYSADTGSDVDSMIFPTIIGVKKSPMFCIQYTNENAVPSLLSGIIFGSDGHIAAGTNEYPNPNMAIAIKPNAGIPGANVTTRCENRIMDAPIIMILVPFPTMSTTAPKMGANTNVKNGIIATMSAATSLSMPNLGISMAVANFLKEITQQ